MPRLRHPLLAVAALATLAFPVALTGLASCRGDRSAGEPSSTAGAAGATPVSGTRTFRYTVVHRWPHDPAAFTEGLEYRDGDLLEGTGMEGTSFVRLTELATGRVLRQVDLARPHFGEGVTAFGNRVYELTWKDHVGFTYDYATLRPLGSFHYEGEGWGLTHDSTELVMSNGSDSLLFVNPDGFHVKRALHVTDQGQPVQKLNELEWVKGHILANVWTTDQIAEIDPQTGHVLGWVDLAGLLSPAEKQPPVDVLNGIAYDAQGDRLFVTGKYWPAVFEIRLQ